MLTEQNSKPERAAVYCRVSSDEQAEAGTIENQVDFAKRYADLNGIAIHEIYLDDGVSGTLAIGKRPQGSRMMADAGAGAFSMVLIYKMDRFARRLKVMLDGFEELDGLGVALRSMTQPFDTATPIGRLFMQMMGSFAEYERETILERTSLGTHRKAVEGKWLGGIVPYGYHVDENGYLAVSEDIMAGPEISEADVVRMCYRLVGDEGWSTIRVADRLNARSIPTSYVKDGRMVTRGKRKEHTSGHWQPGRIRNMLVETIYKGTHYYGRRTKKVHPEVVERAMPAIVDTDLWDRTQTTLRNNQRFSSKNAKRQYLLRGLIKCGMCGLTYIGTPGSSHERAYYKCNGKTAYRGKLMGRCESKPLPAPELEDAVWADILGFARNPSEVIGKLRAKMQGQVAGKHTAEDQMAQTDGAIQRKQRERDAVIGLLRKEIITFEEAERQLDDVAREMEVLRREQNAFVAQLEQHVTQETQLLETEALLEQLHAKVEQADWATRRQLVESLVQEVRADTVGEGRGRKAEATVTYRFEVVTRTGTGSSRQRG